MVASYTVGSAMTPAVMQSATEHAVSKLISFLDLFIKHPLSAMVLSCPVL